MHHGMMERGGGERKDGGVCVCEILKEGQKRIWCD